jgi:hypothetical protein
MVLTSSDVHTSIRADCKKLERELIRIIGLPNVIQSRPKIEKIPYASVILVLVHRINDAVDWRAAELYAQEVAKESFEVAV